MSEINNLICPLSGKVYINAFIAHDGYVYEKEFIEALFLNKETIISPSTGKEMKTGGVEFIKLNEYIKKKNELYVPLKFFFCKNSYVEFYQYDVDRIYHNMINYDGTTVEELLEFISCERNSDYIFNLDIYHPKFIEIINNEKGLLMILDDKIKCDYEHFNKFNLIIEYSSICSLAFDYITKKEAYYFHNACRFGRYDLIVKLYNYDNNYINYYGKSSGENNVFYAGMLSKNIDVLKYLHSIKNTLYKEHQIGHTVSYPMFALCMEDVEIVKFIYSIDNNFYKTIIGDKNIELYHENLRTIFEYCCVQGFSDTIEFLFSIDNNIYNNDPNKDKIIEKMKKEVSYLDKSTRRRSRDYTDTVKILNLIKKNIK